jgi:hypothetical protein
MPNWAWVLILMAALAGVACLGGRDPGPCCKGHAKDNPDLMEVTFCSTRGY